MNFLCTVYYSVNVTLTFCIRVTTIFPPNFIMTAHEVYIIYQHCNVIYIYLKTEIMDEWSRISRRLKSKAEAIRNVHVLFVDV